MIAIDDSRIDSIQIKLPFLLLTLLWKVLAKLLTLFHKTWREVSSEPIRSDLIEKLLITTPVGYRHVHMFCNLFQLILKINGLESALTEYDLIELLFIDRPYFFKTSFEMKSKLFMYFQAPDILRIVFERLEELL